MFWGIKSPRTATACFIIPAMSSFLGCSPSIANAHSVLAMFWGLKSPRTTTARASRACSTSAHVCQRHVLASVCSVFAHSRALNTGICCSHKTGFRLVSFLSRALCGACPASCCQRILCGSHQQQLLIGSPRILGIKILPQLCYKVAQLLAVVRLCYCHQVPIQLDVLGARTTAPAASFCTTHGRARVAGLPDTALGS